MKALSWETYCYSKTNPQSSVSERGMHNISIDIAPNIFFPSIHLIVISNIQMYIV